MFRVNETKCMFSSKEILRILDCKACEVKDFEITEVSVDSRSVNKPESTLFFALKFYFSFLINFLFDIKKKNKKAVYFLPFFFVLFLFTIWGFWF